MAERASQPDGQTTASGHTVRPSARFSPCPAAGTLASSTSDSKKILFIHANVVLLLERRKPAELKILNIFPTPVAASTARLPKLFSRPFMTGLYHIDYQTLCDMPSFTLQKTAFWRAIHGLLARDSWPIAKTHVTNACVKQLRHCHSMRQNGTCHGTHLPLAHVLLNEK